MADPANENLHESHTQQSADETEEWVFTISKATGEIARIEKIDKSTGKRHELSHEEYDAISGMMSPSAAYYATYGYDLTQVAHSGRDLDSNSQDPMHVRDAANADSPGDPGS